jgi:hypothetical protein
VSESEENKIESDLIELIAGFEHDPLGYVLAAFEWGSGELAEFDGPDEWQRETLDTIGNQLKQGAISVQEAIQIAVASGHGIGKSALVAWIILWALSTYEDTKGVVTANTETQLKTKTWSELAKWHRLCINRHWFEFTATAIFSREKDHEKTWRVDMVPWSERNTEAFAGLHNKGKRILLVFDEASAIPDMIWEVSEGALTDSETEIIWCCFGNPTRNIGRFRECFGKFAHRWIHRQIDSREVKITNKEQIARWIEDYGEDSDFVRVRVRGVFPSADSNALFGPDEIDAAMKRTYTIEQIQHMAVVLGGDVARQGDDSSALARRQGRMAFPIRSMRIPDTMLIAAQFSQEMDEHKADATFIDGTGGYGAGVVDAMRNTGHDCTEIFFNGKATDPRFFNKRSEMYFNLSDWIKKEHGALPYDPELKEELLATTYTFQKDKFRICEKDDIKELIGRSPDKADALILTFAFPVIKKFQLASTANRGDYDPYETRTHTPTNR